MEAYEAKCQILCNIMTELAKQNIAVAFSGGVDSSLLLKLAVMCAGRQESEVYAVTANTELHPACDLSAAKKVSEEIGAKHMVLNLKELDAADIRSNPIDRCYRCKKYLFQAMKEKTARLGIEILIEGTNADDLKAYRPGLRAVEELGVKSPLKEAGFTKEEVRRLAKEYGISVNERPSAPCLATRFPYGTELTMENLKKVEMGEDFLRELGLYNVRLRVHDEIARIETDGDSFQMICDKRKEIVKYLKELGYLYITLDLEGFRSGSMDVKVL